VRLPDFIRSSTFRWTLVVSGAFAVCIVLLFGFIYWQTASYITRRVDITILNDANTIAAQEPEQRLATLKERLRRDPRRIRVAAIFAADGRTIAGNVERAPAGLNPSDGVHDVVVLRVDEHGHETQSARVAARALPDGEVVMIGRNIDEVAEIARIVEQALTLGLLPALCLAIGTGMLLSLRAKRRVEEVNERVQRIVAGDLRQRLPTQGLDDPFDNLAGIVNGMLDEIETLIHKLAGVGDDIAHDLRTPLTRVRMRLERGRDNARSVEELRAVADQAIGGLDQSLAIVTALLRIAEIEHSRRLAAFGEVALSDVVREVGDMYEPIAEDRGVNLAIDGNAGFVVRGDRDLLLEAVANLVDNAVKFTPTGGRVALALVHGDDEDVVRISDSGPGIAPSEIEAVTTRFYRSDKSRHTDGLGLGLSLVAAIVKLHGFRMTIGPGPGCVAEIVCPHRRT
jgi:signal transduction histidine kinase